MKREDADGHDEVPVGVDAGEQAGELVDRARRDARPASSPSRPIRTSSSVTDQSEREVVEELVGQHHVDGSGRGDRRPRSRRSRAAPPARPRSPRRPCTDASSSARIWRASVPSPRAHLGDAERVRRAERVGELRQRPREEHAERGMHVRARHEVAVGAHRRIVVEPARPVQRELHERRERDRGPRRGCAFGSRRPDRVPTDAVWRRPARMSAVDERPIRRAASVVCVRADGDGEPEVLVVRRSPESRFLPGYVAFPGGAVDAGDAAHAERWFGDPALAPRAAAVRELVEEAGHHPHRCRARRIRWVRADRRRAAVARAAVGALPLGGAARGAGSLRRPLLHGGGRRRRRGDARRRRGRPHAWWTTARRLLEEWRDGRRTSSTGRPGSR